MRGESDAESVLAEAQSRALAEAFGTESATPVVIAQPTSASPDITDLTFLSWINTGAYEELASLYQEEHPGVTVKVVEFLSEVDYPPERLATTADVFPVFPGFELDAVEGHWLSVQPLVEGDPTVALDDFYPQALEAYRRQGDLWGLPAEIDADMLFYNKTLFDTAGVPYPQPGWTWDDFLAAATRLTQGEGSRKQWGFVTLANGWASIPLILAAQRGGSLVDSRATPTAPTLDDPAVVNTLRWYADLEQSHGVMPPPPVHFADWETTETLVSEGRAAMWITNVGSRYWTHMDVDLGIAPLPVWSAGEQPATMYNVIGYGISAQTAYPQESWHWLTFLTRQPGAMRGPPARRSLFEQAVFPLVPSELQADILQAYQLTLEDYADAGYDGVRAQAPWFDAVYRLYRQAVKQTLDGDDPSETLDAAQAIARAYMACLDAHSGIIDETIGATCEEETGVPAPVVWYEE
jgi:multiple sugar transport system substrate-binding protein